jgi:hypothetical protein
MKLDKRIVIIVVVIIAAGAGYWFWQNSHAPKVEVAVENRLIKRPPIPSILPPMRHNWNLCAQNRSKHFQSP